MDGNGNGGDLRSARAASRTLRLGESLLRLLATQRGLTPEQVCSRLLERLWDASEAGDVVATREVRGLVAAAWVGQGPNNAKGMLRHNKRGMRLGFLTLDDGLKAAKLASAQAEVDGTERTIRELEAVAGTLIRSREEAA